MSEESCTQPILINMLVEIADYISATDFRNFVERNIVSHPYIPHTIVTYIFNIVGVFIKMVKNRKTYVFLFKISASWFLFYLYLSSSAHTIRKFKVENDIDPKEVRMATIMTNSLLEQLQLCSLTCSPQNLFAHPPSSLKTFYSHLVTDEKRTPQDNGKKRPHEERDKDHSPNKKHKGCIVNTTGKRI